MQEIEKMFEGYDIENVKALMNRAANDEETRLIAEGKMDEVINRRTERLRKDNEKKVEELNSRLNVAEQKSNRFKDKVLSGAVRDEALKAGILPEAMDDIVLRARQLFVLNDEGEVQAMDGEEVVFGKDGKSPLSLSEWLEDTREKAPHLWPRASGSNGSGGSGLKAKKPFKELTEAEKVELYTRNPEEYRQLRDQTS